MSNSEKEYKVVYSEGILENKMMELFIEAFYSDKNRPLKCVLSSLEKAILLHSLTLFNGNRKQTAEFLGLKLITLYEKLRRYQINSTYSTGTTEK